MPRRSGFPLLLLAALFVTAGRPVPAAAQEPPPSSSLLAEKDSFHWYVEAKYYTLQRREFRKALECCEMSLRANPYNPKARALKAWLEEQIRNLPEAGTAEVALAGTAEVAVGTGEIALGTVPVGLTGTSAVALTGTGAVGLQGLATIPAEAVAALDRDTHLRLGEDALARNDFARAKEEFLLDLKANPDRSQSMLYIVKHTIDNGDWLKGVILLNRLAEKVEGGAVLDPETRAIADHQLKLYEEAAFLGKAMRSVNRDITTRKMARQSYPWRNVITDLPDTAELFLEEKPLEALDIARLKKEKTLPPSLRVEASDFTLDRDGLIYPRYNFFREKQQILLPKITRDYTGKKDIRSLLEQGDYYSRIGSYDRASKFFRDAIKADPTSAMAHNNLGVIYKLKGRLNDAIELFKTAIALEPSYAEPLNNLGIIYSEMGDLVEAGRLFTIALKLNRLDARTLYNLGFVDEKRGDLKGAIENYKKSVEINAAEAAPLYRLGKIFLDKKDKKEALRYFRKLKGILPRGSAEYEDLIRLIQSIER